MCSHFFSFTSKKVQGFSSNRKILMLLLSVLFYLQKKKLQFFEILVFKQDIWGNIHYVPEINLISSGAQIKALYLLKKTIYKKSETRFCRRKTAEDNNAKTNVFPNILCSFLLFKASAFLQIFFPTNLLFQ